MVGRRTGWSWLVLLVPLVVAGGALAMRALGPVRPPEIAPSPLLDAVALRPADVTPSRCHRTPRGRGLLRAVAARLALPGHVRCAFHAGETGRGPGTPGWMAQVVTDGAGRVQYAGFQVTGLAERPARAAADSLLRRRLALPDARPLRCRTLSRPPARWEAPDTTVRGDPGVRVTFRGWRTPDYQAIVSAQRVRIGSDDAYALKVEATRGRWSACSAPDSPPDVS